MIVVFAVIAATLFLYVAVLKDLDPKPEPKQKKKNPLRHKYNIIYFLMLLGLMFVPLILSVPIIQWNRQYILRSLDAFNWTIFVVSWQTASYYIWIVFGLLIIAIYIYLVFVKRYWRLILIALIQVCIFMLTWLISILFNGTIERFDSLTIDHVDYHLIQTTYLGSGHLYLVSCENRVCHIDQVDYIDSITYSNGELSYDAKSHTLTVSTAFPVADLIEGMPVERFTIPLPEH